MNGSINTMNNIISRSTKKKFVITNSMGELIAIIIFSIVLSFLSDKFLSIDNFVAVSRICSITILVGLSQMVVMAGGGMNVSVGAIGGLAAVICGTLMQRANLPWGIAILLAVIAGTLCGIINGVIISKLGGKGEISWLTTLATASVFTGLSLGITHAKPFYNLPKGYVWIGTYNIGGILSVMLFIVLIFAVIIWAMFKFTSFGRQILAIGGNQNAAALSGIKVNRVLILKHMTSALLATCAGILFSTRLGSINPDIGGDWMLFSFAAPLIGGVRMSGGQVNVFGAVLGGVILSLVSNGVVHMQINIYLVELMQGLIILLAVGLDRIRAIREEKQERLERAQYER